MWGSSKAERRVGSMVVKKADYSAALMVDEKDL